jgi:1-acyl-sn-glycerol-3-phosphate acyltransferase
VHIADSLQAIAGGGVRRNDFVILERHARCVLAAPLRLLHLAIHLLIGLCAALVFGKLSAGLQQAFVRWWARGILKALGVRLHVAGVSPLRPGLIVANHVSWLDVIALATVQPAAFVCKSEIAKWPLIGWLLTRTGTIFIRRGSFRDVWRVNVGIRARLAEQHCVAAFPEGTTSDGSDVLAFRPALYQPAVELGLPVYPVAITYSSGEAVYVGTTSFLESLFSIACARGLKVHLAILPPLHTAGLRRREAALRSRNLILARVHFSGLCAASGAAAQRRESCPTGWLRFRPPR